MTGEVKRTFWPVGRCSRCEGIDIAVAEVENERPHTLLCSNCSHRWTPEHRILLNVNENGEYKGIWDGEKEQGVMIPLTCMSCPRFREEGCYVELGELCVLDDGYGEPPDGWDDEIVIEYQ